MPCRHPCDGWSASCRSSLLVLVLRLPADECFVSDDDPTVPAEQVQWACLHGLTDAVEQEPRALVRQPVAAEYLKRRDPFLFDAISKMTMIQVRSGIFDPCMTVSLRTENGLRHSAHFHRRR